MKVAGQWRYVYRAIDQSGQVIDVFVSTRRDANAAHQFFEHGIATTKITPVEVVTDLAATYPVVLEELLPAAWHRTEQYANNRVEADHGGLKSRLRPMRGFQTGPQRQDRDRRACLCPESSPRPLRAGGRGAGDPAAGGRVRRAGLGDLILLEVGASACRGSTQCNTAPDRALLPGHRQKARLQSPPSPPPTVRGRRLAPDHLAGLNSYIATSGRAMAIAGRVSSD